MERSQQEMSTSARAAGRQHLGLLVGQGQGGLALAEGHGQHLLRHQPDQRPQPQRPPRQPRSPPQQAPVPLALVFGRNVELRDLVETFRLEGLDPGRETAVLQRGERATLLQRLCHHAEELELQPALAVQPALLRASLPQQPAGMPAQEIDRRWARRRPGGHAEVPLLLARPLLLLGVLPALGQQHARLHAGAGATGRRALPQPLAALRPERQKGGGQATETGGGPGATALAGPRQDDPGKRRRCRPRSRGSAARSRCSLLCSSPIKFYLEFFRILPRGVWGVRRNGSAAGKRILLSEQNPLPLQVDFFHKFPHFCSVLIFARRVVVSSWHVFRAGMH